MNETLDNMRSTKNSLWRGRQDNHRPRAKNGKRRHMESGRRINTYEKGVVEASKLQRFNNKRPNNRNAPRGDGGDKRALARSMGTS